MIFNRLPVEILMKVFQYLDQEVDFVHFTMCCKSCQEFRYYRPLYNEYIVSKIMPVSQRYNFKYVFYDIDQFQIQFVPYQLETITFGDNFSADIREIYPLPYLKEINLGTGFVHQESMMDMPNTIINRNTNMMKTIANIQISHLQILYRLNGFYYQQSCDNWTYVINIITNENILSDLDKLLSGIVTTNNHVKKLCDSLKNAYTYYSTLINLFKLFNIDEKYNLLSGLVVENCPREKYIEYADLIKEFVNNLGIINMQKKLWIDNFTKKILEENNVKTIYEYCDLKKIPYLRYSE